MGQAMRIAGAPALRIEFNCVPGLLSSCVVVVLPREEGRKEGARKLLAAAPSDRQIHQNHQASSSSTSAVLATKVFQHHNIISASKSVLCGGVVSSKVFESQTSDTITKKTHGISQVSIR